MATKKKPRVVLGPSTLSATIFEKWARPGAQMPLEHLEAELPDVSRYDLVAALRALEKAGAGELFVGKGHRSRFEWAGKAALAAARPQASESGPDAPATKSKPATARESSKSKQAITRERSNVSAPVRTRKGFGKVPSKVEPTRAVASAGPALAGSAMLEHAFHVRPGVLATFRLPTDLTRPEVDRLCQLLQSIPFV